MRAYDKSRTQHRFCLYLTEDEAAQFLEELESAGLEWCPTLALAHARLNRVFTKWEVQQ